MDLIGLSISTFHLITNGPRSPFPLPITNYSCCKVKTYCFFMTSTHLSPLPMCYTYMNEGDLENFHQFYHLQYNVYKTVLFVCLFSVNRYMYYRREFLIIISLKYVYAQERNYGTHYQSRSTVKPTYGFIDHFVIKKHIDTLTKVSSTNQDPQLSRSIDLSTIS